MQRKATAVRAVPTPKEASAAGVSRAMSCGRTGVAAKRWVGYHLTLTFDIVTVMVLTHL